MSILALTSNTLIGTAAAGNIEYDGQFFGTDSAASRAQLQRIVRATAVTASGTSVDFTGLPAWVKRITVMFSGVSTNGSSAFLIQLGDAGGIENTGYISGTTVISNASVGSLVTSTAGFVAASGFVAANTFHGSVSITSLGSNIWAAGGSTYQAGSGTYVVAGSKTLSDTLTQVRITTANGTDTFDAGTINIIYEG